MERISSTKNPLVKAMKALKDARAREESGLFLVEGEKMIREALGCGLKMHHALAEDGFEAFAQELAQGCDRVFMAPKGFLTSVCDTKTPQGVCAAFEMPVSTSIEKMPDTVVALDGVQDPGNVGTIWRTADAAGFGAILFGGGSADALSPKVQRSTMGSMFRLPFAKCDDLAKNLEQMKQRGYRVLVSVLDGDDFYAMQKPEGKIVLVIGNEARGISAAVQAVASDRVKLPMRGGAESLNAAVAAGIMMYEIMRRRDGE